MHMSHPGQGQGMVCVAVACRLINSVWRRQYVFENMEEKRSVLGKGLLKRLLTQLVSHSLQLMTALRVSVLQNFVL